MKATPLPLFLLVLLVAGCSSIGIEGQFLQPADVTATALATSFRAAPTSTPDLGATAAIERAVRLTLTAAVPSPTDTLPPSPTNTPSPSPTAEPTTAIPPTETPTATATATKKPAPQATFTPVVVVLPFTGTWVGTDTVDGSITTLVLVQTGNTLRGTFSDTYSPNVQPPGFQGSGSGTVLSDTTAQMTFNLSRWDGKTAESQTHLTLSNQNNTLTLTFDSCSGGCPTVLQRQ
jgi:hypothetical protein